MKTLARHQSRLSSLMLITFVLQNFIFPSLLLAVENNVAPKAIPVPEDLPITGNTAPALRAEVVQEAPLPYKAPWLNDTVARSQELNDALMNFKKIDLVASSGDSSESCSGDRTLNQHKAIAKLEALIRLYTNPEKSGFVDNFKIPTQDAGLYQKLYEATDRSVRGDSSGPSVQTVLLELQKYKAKERFQNLENHFVEESKKQSDEAPNPSEAFQTFKTMLQDFKSKYDIKKISSYSDEFFKDLEQVEAAYAVYAPDTKTIPKAQPADILTQMKNGGDGSDVFKFFYDYEYSQINAVERLQNYVSHNPEANAKMSEIHRRVKLSQGPDYLKLNKALIDQKKYAALDKIAKDNYFKGDLEENEMFSEWPIPRSFDVAGGIRQQEEKIAQIKNELQAAKTNLSSTPDTLFAIESRLAKEEALASGYKYIIQRSQNPRLAPFEKASELFSALKKNESDTEGTSLEKGIVLLSAQNIFDSIKSDTSYVDQNLKTITEKMKLNSTPEHTEKFLNYLRTSFKRNSIQSLNDLSTNEKVLLLSRLSFQQANPTSRIKSALSRINGDLVDMLGKYKKTHKDLWPDAYYKAKNSLSNGFSSLGGSISKKIGLDQFVGSFSDESAAAPEEAKIPREIYEAKIKELETLQSQIAATLKTLSPDSKYPENQKPLITQYEKSRDLLTKVFSDTVDTNNARSIEDATKELDEILSYHADEESHRRYNKLSELYLIAEDNYSTKKQSLFTENDLNLKKLKEQTENSLQKLGLQLHEIGYIHEKDRGKMSLLVRPIMETPVKRFEKDMLQNYADLVSLRKTLNSEKPLAEGRDCSDLYQEYYTCIAKWEAEKDFKPDLKLSDVSVQIGNSDKQSCDVVIDKFVHQDSDSKLPKEKRLSAFIKLAQNQAVKEHAQKLQKAAPDILTSQAFASGGTAHSGAPSELVVAKAIQNFCSRDGRASWATTAATPGFPLGEFKGELLNQSASSEGKDLIPHLWGQLKTAASKSLSISNILANPSAHPADDLNYALANRDLADFPLMNQAGAVLTLMSQKRNEFCAPSREVPPQVYAANAFTKFIENFHSSCLQQNSNVATSERGPGLSVVRLSMCDAAVKDLVSLAGAKKQEIANAFESDSCSSNIGLSYTERRKMNDVSDLMRFAVSSSQNKSIRHVLVVPDAVEGDPTGSTLVPSMQKEFVETNTLHLYDPQNPGKTFNDTQVSTSGDPLPAKMNCPLLAPERIAQTLASAKNCDLLCGNVLVIRYSPYNLEKAFNAESLNSPYVAQVFSNREAELKHQSDLDLGHVVLKAIRVEEDLPEKKIVAKPATVKSTPHVQTAPQQQQPAPEKKRGSIGGFLRRMIGQ